MRLPDPARSYAILIGTSSYQSDELTDLPAVRNNLNALATALTNPQCGGFTPGHCTVLPDHTDARAIHHLIRQDANHARDTLLLYFAGHGLTGPRRHELYLGLTDTDTDPDELRVSALPFDWIREIFLDSPATNRVLILDCCYSGRAVADFMASSAEAILGQTEIAGTYTIASATADTLALAPTGAIYTTFTGELVDLLHHGLPDGPELLTLDTIYRHLRHTTTKGLPRPSQRGTRHHRPPRPHPQPRTRDAEPCSTPASRGHHSGEVSASDTNPVSIATNGHTAVHAHHAGTADRPRPGEVSTHTNRRRDACRDPHCHCRCPAWIRQAIRDRPDGPHRECLGRGVQPGRAHPCHRWPRQDGATLGGRKRPAPRCPLTGHTDWIWDVAFSPDGRTLATTSDDKTVRLWDVTNPTTTRPIGAPLAGHTDTVRGVLFSPDGRILITSSEDKTVRLWDVTSGRPLGAPLTGHTDAVRDVAISPDGRTLATASRDETVRLWNLKLP